MPRDTESDEVDAGAGTGVATVRGAAVVGAVVPAAAAQHAVRT